MDGEHLCILKCNTITEKCVFTIGKDGTVLKDACGSHSVQL